MTVPPISPDDDLRGFLLGTLPADRAEVVRAWLEADPTRAADLERFVARDDLTDALGNRSPVEPVPAEVVERVVRGVSDTLRRAGRRLLRRPPGGTPRG